MRRRFSLLFLPMFIVGGFLSLFLFNQPAKAIPVGYSPGDVLITEFSVNTSEWVELQNTTDNDITLAGDWTVEYYNGNYVPVGLSGTLPAKGIVVVDFGGELSDVSSRLNLKYQGNIIHSVSYGIGMAPADVPTAPAADESAMMNLYTQAWGVTSTPSKGWFNNAIDYPCPAVATSTPPTLNSIASCLLSTEGIRTNMSSTPNPSFAIDLYFEKPGFGTISFVNQVTNLTDQEVVTAFRTFSDKMNIASGTLGFNSQLATDMIVAGARLYMYNIDDMGFSSQPDIQVKNDLGVILNPGDPGYPNLTDVVFDTDLQQLSFAADHFTEFVAVPHVEVSIGSEFITNDTTPDAQVSTNATGTYTFLGDCAATGGGPIVPGSRAITLAVLAAGEHSCDFKVTDLNGNYNTHHFTFTVDLTPPTITNLAKNQTTITRNIIGTQLLIRGTPSEAADTAVVPTIEFNPPLLAVLTNRNIEWQVDTFRFLADIEDQAVEGVSVTATIYGMKDVSGNEMATQTWAGFIDVDLVAPTITFTGDVAAGPVTSDTVTITSTSTNPTVPDWVYYGFSPDNVCNQFDDFSYSMIPGGSFTVTTSEHNGQYVCAQSFDFYSNVAYARSTNPLNVVNKPSVTTKDASNVVSTTARLNASLDATNGANIALYGFYYGVNNFASSSIETDGVVGDFSMNVNQLLPGTIYQFMVFASNTAGVTTGTTKTFTTDFAPSAANPTSTITNDNQTTSTINIPTGVTNPSIDFSGIVGIQVFTPCPIIANVQTEFGTVQLSMPDGTDLVGLGADKVLYLPTVKANSSVTVTPDSGKTATVSSVIEIGYGNDPVTFGVGVRLLIPGQAGKYAGYSRAGVFTPITATCGADTQAWADANLAAAGDCKIDVGGDLVIWTKHFTSFITYTQSNVATGGGGGSTPLPPAPILGTNPVIVVEGSSVSKRDVHLKFNVEKAVEVAMSEDSTFSGASWLPFAVEKPFTLSVGNGTKTIYVKFRSEQKGETKMVSVQTTLSGQGTNQIVSTCPALVVGDLVKVVGKPAIYAINEKMELLFFPSGDEFKSWRPTYSGYYKAVSQSCFDSLVLPKGYPAAVNFRPGSHVVKRPNSSQLYVVEPNNTLAEITLEAAKALYGSDFKPMVIADIFWPHYVNRGSTVTAAKPHAGMLVKVGTVTYYVDANGAMREMTSAGITANNIQTKFVRTLSGTAVSGIATGEKVAAHVAEIGKITQ